MNRLLQSSEFEHWLLALTDLKAKARILVRLRSAELGHFGDCVRVGEGISEMRIHVGPGYRLYYIRRDERLYVLLIGGNKSSQKRDIERAHQMARALRETWM
jgi:putative addiction module killer protein